MTTIVFVDDDRIVLTALEGTLRVMHQDWSMHFLSSAQAAIQLLQKTKVDCIVSDICMPDMDGTELLGHVAREYPHIIRIALSGHLSKEIILESVYATHRFIAKPGPASVIEDVINRSLNLHEQLNEPKLKSLIAGITSLPVLPEIYDQLMKELASENYSAASIGKLIESDIGLSAILLKVVNSAYYGLAQNVESPAHAAQLLGADIVKNVLLSEKIVSQFRDRARDPKRIMELNQQASVRGVLASRFAKIANLNKRQIDHSHMAGMMSNLGELIIETYLGETLCETEEPDLPDRIGSSAIGLWSLPDNIVEAVWRQRNKSPIPPAPNGRLSAMHVLYAVRLLEAAFANNGNVLDDSFTAADVFTRSSIDRHLEETWFHCFCDYHRELQLAS
jgi:HD-like signal output (HDOD) protein